MREIKFRYRVSHYKEPEKIITFTGTLNDIENRKWTPNPFDITYNTLSRDEFTGLLDKNGREIFEGDICEYIGDPSRFEVVFEKCAFCKKYPDWDDTLERPVLTQWDIDHIGMHVIGNIHENPELQK